MTPAAYCKLFGKKKTRRRLIRRRVSRRKSRSKSRKTRSLSKSRRRAPRSKSKRKFRSNSRRKVSKRRRGRKLQPAWMRMAVKKRGKCSQLGPTSINPFLNFMRVFRRKRCGWPVSRIAVEGAKLWCRMRCQDKKRFYRQACAMRKEKPHRRGRRAPRRKSRKRMARKQR